MNTTSSLRDRQRQKKAIANSVVPRIRVSRWIYPEGALQRNQFLVAEFARIQPAEPKDLGAASEFWRIQLRIVNCVAKPLAPSKLACRANFSTAIPDFETIVRFALQILQNRTSRVFRHIWNCKRKALWRGVLRTIARYGPPIGTAIAIRLDNESATGSHGRLQRTVGV
jgi:hypothetical protein